MKIINALAQAVLIFSYWLASGVDVHAADITGVWVTNAAACNKVFVKRGNNISFTKDADAYGGGFIIEGNRIRGKIATCNIKTRKEDGSTMHLVASCATDIMLSDVQLSVRIINRDKIARIFPGLPELETSYERCTFN